jgi:hypothetical protein
LVDINEIAVVAAARRLVELRKVFEALPVKSDQCAVIADEMDDIRSAFGTAFAELVLRYHDASFTVPA